LDLGSSFLHSPGPTLIHVLRIVGALLSGVVVDSLVSRSRHVSPQRFLFRSSLGTLLLPIGLLIVGFTLKSAMELPLDLGAVNAPFLGAEAVEDPFEDVVDGTIGIKRMSWDMGASLFGFFNSGFGVSDSLAAIYYTSGLERY
jgi:hypothetical protein